MGCCPTMPVYLSVPFPCPQIHASWPLWLIAVFFLVLPTPSYVPYWAYCLVMGLMLVVGAKLVTITALLGLQVRGWWWCGRRCVIPQTILNSKFTAPTGAGERVRCTAGGACPQARSTMPNQRARCINSHNAAPQGSTSGELPSCDELSAVCAVGVHRQVAIKYGDSVLFGRMDANARHAAHAAPGRLRRRLSLSQLDGDTLAAAAAGGGGGGGAGGEGPGEGGAGGEGGGGGGGEGSAKAAHMLDEKLPDADPKLKAQVGAFQSNCPAPCLHGL